MKVLLCFACLIVGAAVATTGTVAQGDGLLNTREDLPGQFNKIIVGPLDAEFYGLDGEDDADENDEPLGDIEDEIEEILDDLDQVDEVDEELVIEEEEEIETDGDVSEDEEDVPEDERWGNGRRGRGRRRNRNRRLWKKHGKKASRKVSRFMNRRNLTDIENVPPRKFKGHLGQMHRRARQQGQMTGVKKPMRQLYKKVTKKVNRRNLQQQSQSRMSHVCTKISKRSSPRRGLLEKLPAQLREEFTEMFDSRRAQLIECCEMDEEARELCFAEANVDKMDQMCRLHSRHQQMGSTQQFKFKHWQRKANCCEIVDDEERGECFHDIVATMKAEKKMNKNRKTPESRLRAVCKKVDSPIRGPWFKKLFSQMNYTETNKWKAIFQQRRNDMKKCCEHGSVQQRLECAEDLKELRYERVCSGEEDFKPEPRYNAQKHGLLVDTCCLLAGAPRYQCFNNKGRNLQPEQRYNRTTIVTDYGGIIVPVVRPNAQGLILVEVESEGDLEMDATEEQMEDMMMGDAPSGSHRGGGRGRGTHRRQRKDPEVKAVKRDCCHQGKALGQSFPNDGKAIMERHEQCEANSQAYAEDVEDRLADMCARMYKRCCLKTGRTLCSDDDSGRGCGHRRGRGGRRRKMHMNVEVDGDVDDIEELVEEAEKVMEEVVAEQM